MTPPVAATPPIRVLIVGATPTSRDRIARSLGTDSMFEIVARVRPALEADRLVGTSPPTVIVLDASDVLEEAAAYAEWLMATHPIPILAIARPSSLARAHATLIPLGVVDVVADDPLAAGPALAKSVRLVSQIRVVTRRAGRAAPSPIPSDIVVSRGTSSLPGVVAVGASTGGPSAVSEFLKHLPRNLPVPVLIVIHIGPSFGHSLADWLDLGSSVPVHAATDGLRVECGHAYVCPPEKHLVLRDDRLALTTTAERHSCRPSVDVLFESVAEQLGDRAIGCLFTGIGRDGASGLLEMYRRGAFTTAQDESSCAVYGMPREAFELGAVSAVAPPSRMATLVAAHAARFVARDSTRNSTSRR